MTNVSWLIDETTPIDESVKWEIENELDSARLYPTRGTTEVPDLAIRVQDIIIYDNKKWFGEADIRLDALVIHGRGKADEMESFYMPGTFRFSRVADGDRLPTGDTGLLLFYGKPLHFLDIFITVSRDHKDSDDLATLLSGQLQSKEIKAAFGMLLGLAVAAPQVAIVTAAVESAVVIGNFAYQILRKATGSTVGLYHTSLLQYRDGFGIGRHPKTGNHKVKDLSFWYEIIHEEATD